MKQTSGKKGETRADVTVKKLLRMMKQFYDQKMDKLFSFKSKRFRKNQELFLKFTDNFVKKFIRNDFLKLLNINLYVMSEHLAALIQPRSFLVEMETRKKDINLLLESQAEVQSENQSDPNAKTAENLVKSWQSSYRQYLERLIRVRALCDENRKLLYLNYNKHTFNGYISKTENLLLLENFLQKLQQSLSSLKSKVIIQKGQNLVNKRSKKLNSKSSSAASERTQGVPEWGDNLAGVKMGFDDFSASLLHNVEEWLKK